MSRFGLLMQQQPVQPTRPYRDWFADVERRLMRRTGECMSANAVPEAYWLGSYQCGESAYDAADEFIRDRRR